MSGMKEPRVVATYWSDDGVSTPTESWIGEAMWNDFPNASGEGLPPTGCATRTEGTYGRPRGWRRRQHLWDISGPRQGAEVREKTDKLRWANGKRAFGAAVIAAILIATASP